MTAIKTQALVAPCECLVFRKVAVLCTAAMVLAILSLEATHAWAVGRHEDLKRETSAMFDKALLEVEYARAIDSAVVYWYQACEQKPKVDLCLLAREVVRIRHDDYAGGGVDRYAREPAILQWMKTTAVQ